MKGSTRGEPRIVRSVEGRPVRGLVTRRVLAAGNAALVLELSFERGAASETHRHDHESICYVLGGRIRTTVGGRPLELGAGEVCVHPAGVDHAVKALEDSVILEIKSPPPDPEQILGTDDPGAGAPR